MPLDGNAVEDVLVVQSRVNIDPPDFFPDASLYPAIEVGRTINLPNEIMISR